MMDSTFPWPSLIPLLISRMAEGVAFTVVYPYMPQLMRDLGVVDTQVGTYTALADGILQVTECIAAPFVGGLGDRYGRKPVFVISLALMAILGLCFGFTDSVFTVVFVRGLFGCCAACGVLSRTMVSEICQGRHLIRAWAIFSPALQTGFSLGPLIGGSLSNPATRYDIFANSDILKRYPYLLPSLVTGALVAMAVVLSYRNLPETKPPMGRKSSSHHGSQPQVSFIGLLIHEDDRFRTMVTIYGLANAVTFSYEAIFPVFAFMEVEHGGLGMTTPVIGNILGASALLGILMTITLFPVVHRFMSRRTFLLFSLTAYAIGVLLFPLLWLVVSNNGMGALGWTVMCFQVLARRFGDFSLTLLDTMVLDSIPSPDYLNTANSAAFSIAAMCRALGPFVLGWLFGVSSTFDVWLPRQLVWIAYLGICAFPIMAARRMEIVSDSSSDYELLQADRELENGQEDARSTSQVVRQ